VRRDLALATAATCATAAVVLVAHVAGATGAAGIALRTIAGLPLVLVLPGYALSLLLLPSLPHWWWRAGWSAGLSLAIAVLAGLLLNLLPSGITTVTWTTGLAAVTLAALTATALIPGGPRVAGGVHGQSVRNIGKSWNWGVVAVSFLAVALAAGAVAIAVVSASRPAPPGFAQLWLVPAAGSAASVGVRNAYPEAETFQLLVWDGGSPAIAWTITLGPGQQWQRAVRAVAGKTLSAQLTTPGPVLTARLAS
jgi:uncharacterized membrane protein